MLGRMTKSHCAPLCLDICFGSEDCETSFAHPKSLKEMIMLTVSLTSCYYINAAGID